MGKKQTPYQQKQSKNTAPFHNLICDIESAINDLLKNTWQIQRAQLYKYMGFPDDWKRIETLSV